MSGTDPLSPEECSRVMRLVEGRGVLVAGQAVAWWAEYYAAHGRLPELLKPTGMYVSKDVDIMAPLVPQTLGQLVKDVASGLGGRLDYNPTAFSVLSAVVQFRDADREEREVDFLKRLHGVEKQDEILDLAVQLVAEGRPDVYIIHPVLLFESRVANVLDLEEYRDDKGIRQAQIAGAVLREWHRDQLDDGWKNAKWGIARTLRLACRKRGRRAYIEFGIDVLASIPQHSALPTEVTTEHIRRCRGRLARAIEAGRAS